MWWWKGRKSVTTNPEAIIQFSSWADTFSLLIWPCCGWVGDLKVIRYYKSYMVPCTLFPIETAIGMLSLMSFLISICIEKRKFWNEIQVPTRSLHSELSIMIFFFFSWEEQNMLSQLDCFLKKIRNNPFQHVFSSTYPRVLSTLGVVDQKPLSYLYCPFLFQLSFPLRSQTMFLWSLGWSSARAQFLFCFSFFVSKKSIKTAWLFHNSCEPKLMLIKHIKLGTC